MNAQVDHRVADDLDVDDPAVVDGRVSLLKGDDAPAHGAPAHGDLHTGGSGTDDGSPADGDAVADRAADERDGGADDDGYDPSATVVVQDAPSASPASLRVDFGAHLEANYQRLVAQLYAITLDPGEAHDLVRDAYSRAWRKWAEIGSGPDPTGWVRRVAVRSTHRGWRRWLERVGLARPRAVGDGDPRTAALLAALGRLRIDERRSVVLFHMVGMARRDIAVLEQVTEETVLYRLRRAHQVVSEGLADELSSVLGVAPAHDDPYTPHAGSERQY